MLELYIWLKCELQVLRQALCETRASSSTSWSLRWSSTKTRGSKSASIFHCNDQDVEPKARVSHKTWRRTWSLHFNQMWSSSITSTAKREARSPRFNYRGTLCLCYNFPHYWVNYCPRNEGVNPHYGGFLGDSFTPETPINSSVCYWRGVDFERILIRASSWEILKSSTLLITCWVQVCSCLKSLWDFIG